MWNDTSLGRAGRPGGVDDVGGVFGCDRGGHIRGVFHAVSARFNCDDLRSGVWQPFAKLLTGHHHPGLSIVQNEGDAVVGIDRI